MPRADRWQLPVPDPPSFWFADKPLVIRAAHPRLGRFTTMCPGPPDRSEPDLLATNSEAHLREFVAGESNFLNWYVTAEPRQRRRRVERREI